MRKVILSVALSMDGFIEDSKGAYDWCTPPAKGEMEKFLKRIDAIFYGRKSFELAGANAFPGKKNYVVSKTLKGPIKNTEIISSKVLDEVKNIKHDKGKDIWLYGGAELTTFFINHDLVDEINVGLIPIILGSGKPLFQNINQRKKFIATSAKVSSPDLIYLDYVRKS
jgi:Dihydrofolate reductase